MKIQELHNSILTVLRTYVLKAVESRIKKGAIYRIFAKSFRILLLLPNKSLKLTFPFPHGVLSFSVPLGKGFLIYAKWMSSFFHKMWKDAFSHILWEIVFSDAKLEDVSFFHAKWKRTISFVK